MRVKDRIPEKENAGPMNAQLGTRAEKNTSAKGQRAARQTVGEAAGPPIKERLNHNNVGAGEGEDEERWRRDMDTLRRAAAMLVRRRTNVKRAVPATSAGDSFQRIAESLDNSSPKARGSIVRVLYDLDPDRATSFFNLALRERSLEDRRLLAAAMASSGLVNEAIQDLTGDSYEDSYYPFSILFLAAKAGEFQTLMPVIENHPSIELRVAVIRLLASSGEPEIAPTFRRLALSTSLPAEVRFAVTESIKQIDGQKQETEAPAASKHK